MEQKRQDYFEGYDGNPFDGYDPDKELDDLYRAASNKVSLIPLAITDLSLRYARRISENKIIHYRVSAIQSIVGVPGFDPFTSVKEHILEFEPNAEVELADSIAHDRIRKNYNLSVQDISNKVLTPKLRTALGKRVEAHVYQYLSTFSFQEAFTFKEKVASIASRIGLEKYIPSKYKLRRVSCASYLSYTYEEQDEALAVEAMRKDLQMLADKGLIIAHLATPSTIFLADTVGSGVASKALFCFLFVDQNKLLKELGLDNILKMPRLPLRELGIRSENFEGSLGYHLSSSRNYQIEEVAVASYPIEANRQAVIQSYLGSRELVNEIANRQRDALKDHSVQTESVTAEDGKVHVNMKISKPE